MKVILFIHLLMLVLLASCGSKEDDVRAFIPGVYVSEWQSEFAISRDTLVIAEPQGSDVYSITRRTSHRYIGEQEKRSPQYRADHWTAGYAPREKVLLVYKNGRVLSFDPGEGVLKMGITIYKKL